MAKDLHELSNDHLRVSLTNYGARLVSLEFKSRQGDWIALCAGFSDLETYEIDDFQYFGATVGRVAGRLAEGKFGIGGKTLSLETNEGPNHLHGGVQGATHNKDWTVGEIAQDAITFELLSEANAGGFPGNVHLVAEYRLLGSKLQITYEGRTDSETPLNLTNHSYWNLSGQSDSASNHVLVIDADLTIPLDGALLACGEARAVSDTELDFRNPRKIGVLEKYLSEPLPGYDHTYLLRQSGEAREVARLSHPGSGLAMTISTDAEALQFYSGNRNPSRDAGAGMKISQGSTICLEAFGVNNPEIVGPYSSIVVTPEKPFRLVVTHEFKG